MISLQAESTMVLNQNAIEDPKNAVKFTHPGAWGIDTLMKIVTGVELEYDAQYVWKRKNNGLWMTGQGKVRNAIDIMIGFNPNCID